MKLSALNQPPKNQRDALTKALILAITAPTEAKSRDAVALAESFAHGLTKEEVQQCKWAAQKAVNAMEQE